MTQVLTRTCAIVTHTHEMVSGMTHETMESSSPPPSSHPFQRSSGNVSGTGSGSTSIGLNGNRTTSHTPPLRHNSSSSPTLSARSMGQGGTTQTVQFNSNTTIQNQPANTNTNIRATTPPPLSSPPAMSNSSQPGSSAFSLFPPIGRTSPTPSTQQQQQPSSSPTPPHQRAASTSPHPSGVPTSSNSTIVRSNHTRPNALKSTIHSKSFNFVAPIPQQMPLSPTAIGVGAGAGGATIGAGMSHSRSGSVGSTSPSPVLDAAYLDKQYKRSLLNASAFGSFGSFPAAAMLALIEIAQTVTFTRGEHVLRMGDLADHVLILGPNASVQVEAVLLSPCGGSPGSSLRRLQSRGSQSPPIASSGLAVARARGRRNSMPLPQPVSSPQPLTSIREQPVAPIATLSNMMKAVVAPSLTAEEDKIPGMLLRTQPVVMGSPTDEPMEEYVSPRGASSTSAGGSSGSSSASSSNHSSPESPSMSSERSPSPSPSAPPAGIIRLAGAVLGCEALVANGPLRRTYSARVLSDGMECLLVSYADLRTKVFPLLSLTPLGAASLSETLGKHLVTKELDGFPVRNPVPTLASITASQETICPPPGSVSISLSTEVGNSPTNGSNGVANHGRSLSLTGQCKYPDADLLAHPLFQKVFYVFCQQESTHELLEFWRDCMNYRSGYNKQQLSVEEEAKILHRAYLRPDAKKYQKHLPKEVQTALTTAILAAPANVGSGTSTFHRFIFLDAERHTENLLTSGSLHRFKSTAAFTKILPFVKLDPKMRARNEEARRSLTGTPTGTPPQSGPNTPTRDPATPLKHSRGSESPPPLHPGTMQRAVSLPETEVNTPGQSSNMNSPSLNGRSCSITDRSTPVVPDSAAGTPLQSPASHLFHSPSNSLQSPAPLHRSSAAAREIFAGHAVGELALPPPAMPFNKDDHRPFVPRVAILEQSSATIAAHASEILPPSFTK